MDRTKPLLEEIARKFGSMDFSGVSGMSTIMEAAKMRMIDFFVNVHAGFYTSEIPERLFAAFALRNSPVFPGSAFDFFRLPDKEKALILAGAAHSLDMDDGHFWAGIHASGPVIGTALAMSFPKGCLAGRQLLELIVKGYELEYRFAKALGKGHLVRGFHPSSTCAIIGASFVAASILTQDTDFLLGTLSLAAMSMSGSRQVLTESQEVKPLQVALATERGVESAFFALAGFHGPVGILDGKYGILKNLTDRPVEEFGNLLFRELGTEYHVHETYTKVFPCCRYIFPAIDCAKQLLEQDFHRVDIEAIQIRTFDRAVQDTCGNLRPANRAEARFSLPYIISAVLAGRSVTDSINEVSITPEQNALLERMTCEASPEWNAKLPEIRGANIRVTFGNGRVLEASSHLDAGENASARDQVLGKGESVFAQTGHPEVFPQVVEAVDALEEEGEAARFSETIMKKILPH